MFHFMQISPADISGGPNPVADSTFLRTFEPATPQKRNCPLNFFGSQDTKHPSCSWKGDGRHCQFPPKRPGERIGSSPNDKRANK
jgi:hypothetical protein